MGVKLDKLLKQHIEKFLSELPIKDHIKNWDVYYHGTLKLPKGNIEISDYDLRLHTHYDKPDGQKMYVIIGVKVK